MKTGIGPHCRVLVDFDRPPKADVVLALVNSCLRVLAEAIALLQSDRREGFPESARTAAADSSRFSQDP